MARPNLTLRAPPRYHRNGSGDGFYLVLFCWRDSNVYRDMTAIVTPPVEAEDGTQSWSWLRVYVFQALDRDSCFDGAYFAPQLIEWCRHADASADAYRTLLEINAS